jgi:integrase
MPRAKKGPVYTDADGRHRIEFQQAGIRVHRRLPEGVTRAEAEALATKLKRDLFTSGSLGVSPAVPLPAAIQLWLTDKVSGQKAYDKTKGHARALLAFVVNKTLADIPDVADRYRTHAKKAGLKPATINRRLAVLKGTARFAYMKKLHPENLSTRVWFMPEHNERHVYLTGPQALALAEMAPSPEGRAWIALAAFTGLRKGELHRLGKPGGGTVERGAIYLQDPKTVKSGKPRMVPVPAKVRRYLKHVPFERSMGSLDWEWQVTRAAAGRPGLRFHDLRHTYASLLANKDVPLAVVGVLLGHATAQTTKRYAHLYDETLKRAVAKL